MLRLHTRPRGPSPLTPRERADGAAAFRWGGHVPPLSSQPCFQTIAPTVLESCSHVRSPFQLLSGPLSPILGNLKRDKGKRVEEL